MLVVSWSSPVVGTILLRSLRHMDRSKRTFRRGVLNISGEVTEASNIVSLFSCTKDRGKKICEVSLD